MRLCAVLLTAATPARGEAKGVEPPAALGAVAVPYPSGASGDADVILELVVDQDGAVTRARAIAGGEPFSGAAERAATGWRFSPARRAERPVAARIRVAVRFRAPQAARAPVPPAAPAPPPSAAPEVIQVRGALREPASVRMTRAEVREVPGAFGDPLRALEILPGVAPIENGSPFYVVRGAPPGNDTFLVDGVRVPLLYHVGVGPSVLAPDLIDHVDFYPGAPPAAFGHVAGAVVAAALAPPPDAPRAEASLRLFDAGALIEAPFDDGRATALAAARYAYPGAILAAVSPSIRVGYWDYQSRASLRIGEREQLSVLAFGSHDEFAKADDRTGVLRETLASDFHRVDLRYDRALGTYGRLRAATTLGWTSQGADPVYADDMMVGMRVEAEIEAARTFVVRYGADAQIDKYRLHQSPAPPPPPPSALPTRNVTGGAYAELVWRPAPGVVIVPGIRVDGYASSGPADESAPSATTALPAIDPRLTVRVTLGHGVAWLSTFALAHQQQQTRVGSASGDVLSIPTLPSGGPGLQANVQTSQGLEARLPGELTLTTTAFASTTFAMTDVTPPCELDTASTPPRFDCPDRTGRGRAFGLELGLRRPLTRGWTGAMAYTVSRSTLEMPGRPGEAPRATPGLSPYDRTHVVGAVVAGDLGAHWRGGARFTFYSGHPYALEPDAVLDGARRFAPFYRLDVRVEKRWRFRREGSVAFVVEGQNVTLSRDGGNVRCPLGAHGGAGCTVVPSGAVAIPSVGVEAFF